MAWQYSLSQHNKEYTMEHFTAAVQQYVNFEGRNTRTQYWMFILFYMIFYVVCAIVGKVIGTTLIALLYSLALLLPSIAGQRAVCTTPVAAVGGR
jgi:hypothetical protein